MAYVSKINGYDIKDKEAHSRLDTVESTTATHTSEISSLKTSVANAGKIDNVQIDGTNLTISSKAVNIQTDGAYNATSNKMATVKTVTDKIAAVVASAPTAYDTLKEIADYIASDTTGAAQMSNNIAKNATDIDNLEATVGSLSLEETYNSADQSLELELGNGGTSTGGGYKNAKYINLPLGSSNSVILPADAVGIMLLISGYSTATQKLDTLNVFLPTKGFISAYEGGSIDYALCGVETALAVAYDKNADVLTLTLNNSNISIGRAFAVLFFE